VETVNEASDIISWFAVLGLNIRFFLEKMDKETVGCDNPIVSFFEQYFINNSPNGYKKS